MRRSSLLVALLAVLALASGAEAKTLFVLKGKGNGHGVGMSQWGAYGLAIGYAVDHPHTYQEILAHYFQDTKLGNRSGASVLVSLASGRSSVTIGSGAAFEVSDSDRTASHDAGSAEVKKNSAGRIKVEGIRGAFDSPATFAPTTRPMKLGSMRYRGKLIVKIVSGRLQVLNRVGIDAYARGVVTLESLDSWGDEGAQEALNAQAVAARSYGLYKFLHGGGNCGGALCPDTRDQVYGGIAGETANGNEAVDATLGKVVTYAGDVAETFFSSSSGGHTAASVDTWGGDLAYLQSVSDPADLNPSNPHRSWVVLRTASEFQRQLSLERRPTDAVISQRASGRARAIMAKSGSWSQTVTDSPTTSAFGSEYFRGALGLKSGRFWLGVQAIRADKSSVQCGDRVRLYVFAHDVGSVSAQQRPAGSSTWTSISLNKIDATHWKATRRPCTSMDYRVVSGQATGPKIHVSVSPSIAFAATQQADGLDGRITPIVPGSLVTVERRGTDGWEPVAYATVGEDGTFDTEFPVSEGVYRATVSPLAPGGFLPGYTRKLTVVFG
jgi:SpoIID/LytB domain protein